MSDVSGRKRPRPRARVVIDPDNAYAQLGVSPLSSTEDIKALLNDRRASAIARRRSRGQQQFGAEEAEMARLQKLEAEIGTPRARVAYDREHPQNELLTVQRGPGDRRLEPRHALGVVTAWLQDELGSTVALPSPDSLPLWAPGGISPELAGALAPFEADAPDEGGRTGVGIAPGAGPTLQGEELGKLSGK
ncbi:hypothetical protein [Pyxidicoccus caerfyrddinensis]|uniref:hypothetical protein n=1 Tax=Pyxidicoccus caerfyrddinensis TaxID=2709663 RepID=UPI0013DB9128|nr:hypothetical protein [Pyxidicoccus caerfyrddinensis]